MTDTPQRAYKARRAAKGMIRTEVMCSPEDAVRIALLASLWGCSKNSAILRAVRMATESETKEKA